MQRRKSYSRISLLHIIGSEREMEDEEEEEDDDDADDDDDDDGDGSAIMVDSAEQWF